jgi:hypothetical protein
MTGDPPRRWPDDSPEEDFEVNRAREIDKLGRFPREQMTRPLVDALVAGGFMEQPGEAVLVALVKPDWFDQVPEPGGTCMWCQRPDLASPCPECREAREQGGDPAAAWAWWAGLTAGDRRLMLAARWRLDPWTGRPVRIETGWTQAGDDGTITTARHPFHPVVPSTAWDLLRRGGPPIRRGLPWS